MKSSRLKAIRKQLEKHYQK